MSAKDLQIHNQQSIKLRKSIGLIKDSETKNRLQIYEAYYSSKKIRDFKTNDEVKLIIDLIGKWRFYVGIKEPLTQDEIKMNVTFIRDNFSDLNLIDINQAINLSINGTLKVDVEHYQNFTPIYISRILQSYREYRSNLIFDIRDKIKKKEMVTTLELSNDEKLSISKENLNNLYLSKNSRTFNDYGSVVYNFIKSNKLIVFNKNFVDEAMRYGREMALKKSRESAYADVIQNSQKNLTDEKAKRESSIREYARNFVIQKWLNSFSQEKWNEFLSTITFDMIK